MIRLSALIFASALLPALSLADQGVDLFREVIATGRICSYSKDLTGRQDCYVRSSPERCEREARAGVMGNSLFFAQLRACIISCGAAGAWSSRFGDCSRSLVIEDAESKYRRLNDMGCFSNPDPMLRLNCELDIADL